MQRPCTLTNSSSRILIIRNSALPHITGDNFAKIPNIVILRILKCQCRKIDDDAFDNLLELETVDISGNVIRQIPAAVAKVRKLKQLDLVANNITSLPFNGSFITKANLLKLDFSQNSIQKIEDNDLVPTESRPNFPYICIKHS